MAVRARLERATYGLEGSCSIQLSYRTNLGNNLILEIYFAKRTLQNSSYGETMRLLIILLLVAPLLHLLHGDGGRELRFVALEQYEERNKLLQIRKGMNDELAARDDRSKRIAAMEARLFEIARTKNVENRLQEYLKLRRRVRDTLSEIKASNNKQVELAGLIDVAAVAGGNLPQVENYLNEARSQLRDLGITQGTERKRLEKLLKDIRIAIANVPAPAEYTTESGLKMILVRSSGRAFYISSTPLSTGNVTLAGAGALVKKISQDEGEEYRLPELAECRALSQLKKYPECAVWTCTKMEGKDVEQDRIFARFDIDMYYVWDHDKVLHRGAVFGELPFAEYSKLGCYAVADVNVGKKKRWSNVLGRISSELDAEKDGNPVETDK